VIAPELDDGEVLVVGSAPEPEVFSVSPHRRALDTS
jgi:hypothetical protein